MRRAIVFATPTTIAPTVATSDLSRNHIQGIRVILVRAPQPGTRPATIFFHMRDTSPILRIAILGACLVSAISCDKLGLGDKSPTAPSGPPAAGSSIVYTAIGASDAIGFGSSAPCGVFADCRVND